MNLSDSSDSDTYSRPHIQKLPQFKSNINYNETNDEKCCKQPNYRNINSYLLAYICVVFLICQLFTYYCLDNASGLAINVNPNHFSWVNSLVVLITLTYINVKLKKKTERTLIKVATICTFIACMMSLSYVALLFLVANEDANNNQTVALDVFSAIYAFGITILASISLGFQFVACFCYMIKCIPKTNDNGLIVGLFMLTTIVGKKLYQSFDSVTLAYGIEIVIYVGAVIMLIFILYLDKLLPIPSFNDKELDMSNVIIRDQVVDPMMCQERQSIVDKRMDYSAVGEPKIISEDDTASNDLSKFQISSGSAMKNKQLALDNLKNSTPAEVKPIRESCINKLPSWVQFYYYVLFKTTNGAILLIQSALFAFQQAMLASYSSIAWLPQLNECQESPNKEQIVFMQCLPDRFLFKNIKTFTIVIEIATTLIMGYVYDLLIQHEATKGKLVFRLFQVSSVMTLCSLCIPSIVGLDNAGFRDFFMFMLMILESYNHMFVLLNLITMFKGGYRIAVCMVLSFIYFFTFVFDLIYFVQGFIGNGIIELIVFAVMYGCYLILQQRINQ
ncbi:Conserved_hypothetical protein [Hexamita inflata]|uniref:Transmembrane protein n=1 Tax=Hexamita inflata TaxID=28002 RepID=A0AA86V3S1_9EUKA|nr:Conserved hypothetical protein [Hexamita inflata]